MTTNAQRLRDWLRRCPAIDRTRRFGVDYLSGETAECALLSMPSALRWRENILGRRALRDEQEQSFLFVAQAPYGAEMAQNLENLRLCRQVMDWIADRNGAGDFPPWEGGAVTGVTPVLTAAPVSWGAGSARYQIQIRVNYRLGKE